MKKVTFSKWRSLMTTLLFLSVGLFTQSTLLAQNPGCLPTPGFPDAPAGLTCAGVLVPQVVLTETFDTGFGIFTPDVTGTTNNLTLSTNGDTPSSGTGSECNPEGMSGPEYIFLETSFDNGETHCMTTIIDLTAESSPLELSFWYYMFGDNIGELTVNVNGGQVFIAGPGQIQTGQTDPWLQASVNLDAYAGGIITLQVCMMEGVGASTFEGDISIDHLQVWRCALPPPIINCPMPDPLIASTDPGVCTAQVSFSNAVAIDPDGGPVVVVQTMGPPSGSNFPIGDTIIEFTATDDEGDTATCQFTITVEDNEPPMITCPADITMDSDPGICGAVVNYPSPTVVDNCFMGGGTVTDELTTIFNSNNGGSTGGAVYFDISVDANDISITELDLNMGEAGAFTVDVYTLVGTAFGNETNAGAWTLATTGAGTSAGDDNPSNAVLNTPIVLSANTTYGIALVLDAGHGHEYSGSGSNPAPGMLMYSNSDLSMSLGSATNVPFTGSPFNPRIWNGTVRYDVTVSNAPYNVITGFPSGGVFPVGTTLTTLEYVDAGGNAVQCSFNVTVNDVEAPTVSCVGQPGTYDSTILFANPNLMSTNAFNFLGTPTGAVADGTLVVTASGDIDGAIGGGNEEAWTILDEDGNFVGIVGNGSQCSGNVMASFPIPAAMLDAWAADGQIDFTGTDVAGNVNTTLCGDDSLQLQLMYDTPGGMALDVILDANGMATIPATDLVLGWDDNCGAGGVTITGNGPGGTPGQVLMTNNTGSFSGLARGYFFTAPVDFTMTSIRVPTFASPDEQSIQIMRFAAPPPAFPATGSYDELLFYTGLDVDDGYLPVNVSFTAGDIVAILGVRGADVNAYTTDPTIMIDGNPVDIFRFGTQNPISTAQAPQGSFWTEGSANKSMVDFNYTVGGAGGTMITFTCDDLGETQVVVTATDMAGNESTCTATVNVIDNTPPVLVCMDVTIGVGPNGTTDITPMDLLAESPTTYDVITISSDGLVGQGFTDLEVPVTAAEVVSFDWDYTTGDSPAWDTFGYLLNGVYTVLTDPNGPNDQSGNSGPINLSPGDVFGFRSESVDNGLGPATTTISGFVPGFEGQFDPANWVLTLTNSNGDAFFVEIPGGPLSFDACGITTMAVDIIEVTCDDIANSPLTATVFATDASGNLAACQSMITVVDLLGPEVTCPGDQTVDPGPGNLFYILPDYWATGEATATDNCTDPVVITSMNPPAGTPLSDGVYTIQVIAEDEYGNIGICEFELTVESILGADDNALNTAISMYPNPAQEYVTIANGSNILLDNAMIYDVNGKLISTIDLHNMGSEKVIDVSNLASGVYMVQITSERSSVIKRLLKE